MDLLDNNLIKLALVLTAAMILLNMISEEPKVDNLEEPEMETEMEEMEEPEMTPADMADMVNTESEPAPAPEMKSDDLTAEELLPKSVESEDFAKRHPGGEGPLADKNFLTSGFHVGINTVGTSLRNANTGLRSEPTNPTDPLSPWNNTTITPDINRRGFTIGCE